MAFTTSKMILSEMFPLWIPARHHNLPVPFVLINCVVLIKPIVIHPPCGYIFWKEPFVYRVLSMYQLYVCWILANINIGNDDLSLPKGNAFFFLSLLLIWLRACPLPSQAALSPTTLKSISNVLSKMTHGLHIKLPAESINQWNILFIGRLWTKPLVKQAYAPRLLSSVTDRTSYFESLPSSL